MRKICSKLTLNTLEQRRLRRWGVFIVNFYTLFSHIVLACPLLTLKKQMSVGCLAQNRMILYINCSESTRNYSCSVVLNASFRYKWKAKKRERGDEVAVTVQSQMNRRKTIIFCNQLGLTHFLAYSSVSKCRGTGCTLPILQFITTP